MEEPSQGCSFWEETPEQFGGAVTRSQTGSRRPTNSGRRNAPVSQPSRPRDAVLPLPEHPEIVARMIAGDKRTVSRFNFTSINFKLEIYNAQAGQDVGRAVGALRTVLDAVLNRVKEKLLEKSAGPIGDCLIFISLNSESLKTPVVLPLKPLTDLTTERLQEKIEAVAQSNEDFLLSGEYTLHVSALFHPPKGAGRKKKKMKFIEQECEDNDDMHDDEEEELSEVEGEFEDFIDTSPAMTQSAAFYNMVDQWAEGFQPAGEEDEEDEEDAVEYESGGGNEMPQEKDISGGKTLVSEFSRKNAHYEKIWFSEKYENFENCYKNTYGMFYGGTSLWWAVIQFLNAHHAEEAVSNDEIQNDDVEALGKMLEETLNVRLVYIEAIRHCTLDKVLYCHKSNDVLADVFFVKLTSRGKDYFYYTKRLSALVARHYAVGLCYECEVLFTKCDYDLKRVQRKGKYRSYTLPSSSHLCEKYRLSKAANMRTDMFVRMNLSARLKRNPSYFMGNKKSLVPNGAPPGLCCAVAIMQYVCHMEKGYAYLTHTREVEAEALKLHEEANVPVGPVGVEELTRFQSVLAQKNYLLHVIYKSMGMGIGFRGDYSDFAGVLKDPMRHIYLVHYDDHFVLCRKPFAFSPKTVYCHLCDTVGCTQSHACKKACYKCRRQIFNCPKEPYVRNLCMFCQRDFYKKGCYESHSSTIFKVGAGRFKFEYTVCDRYKQCGKCLKLVDLLEKDGEGGYRFRSFEDHRCGEFYCRVCFKVVPEDHRCFIQKPEPREVEQFRFLFADFEAHAYEEDGVHEVCLVKALHVCQDCQDDETMLRECPSFVAGSRRMMTFGSIEEFGLWLLSPLNGNTICFFHNMKGYDGRFLLRYMVSHGHVPKVILNGGQIMSIHHTPTNLKVRDTLNFFHASLASLTKMFGLPVSKGYFPHKFNTKANRNYVGPLPDVEFYNPDFMGEKEREEFFLWHAEERSKGEEWNLREVEDRYCEQDVIVLAKASIKFRHVSVMETGIDPLTQCITLASFALQDYLQNHMPEDSIGALSTHTHRKVCNASEKSLTWLLHLIARGIASNTFRTCLHPQGEKKLGFYLVDGFDEVTQTVYEFQGCYFHGCPKCFPRRSTQNPQASNKTMEELYDETKTKVARLRDLGYRVEEMWEHDWDKKCGIALLTDDFRECMKPLNVEDAMFGGRCCPLQTYKSVGPGEEIHYYDFTSLYPYSQLQEYPLGHPEVNCQFADRNDEQMTEIIRGLFGFAKVKILPCRNHMFPPLPQRIRGKLMFPLCRTCAEENAQVPVCDHEESQRWLVGTWASIELQKALDVGYKILFVYETHHYPETSRDLFRSYVLKRYKGKEEASGWPSGVETEEQKNEHVERVLRNCGVELERENIVKNPALRALQKLLMNALWGKFGEKLIKRETTFFADPVPFFKLLSNPENIIKEVYAVNDECLMVHHEKDPLFAVPKPSRSVVVAAWTLAVARTILWSAVTQLEPDQVLYTDTDSIIFSRKEGQPTLPLGQGLGQLTSELDAGDFITEFVAVAPKAYAYKTRMGKSACKFKGLRASFAVNQTLHLRSMLDLVETPSFSLTVPNPHIGTDRLTMVMKTQSNAEKTVRHRFDKRVLFGTKSMPFGYNVQLEME